MEQGDRMRFHQVNKSIHRGQNTGFPRLWSRRSVHLNHQLEQGEHRLRSRTDRRDSSSEGSVTSTREIILVTKENC